MKRNMLLGAIFFALGVFAWNNYNLITLFAVGALCSIYCIWCCLKRKYFTAVFAVFSVCIGFLLINNMYSEYSAIGEKFTDEEIVVSGRVYAVDKGDSESSFDAVCTYNEGEKERKIKVRVSYKSDIYAVKYGDEVKFKAKFMMPSEGSGFGDLNSRMSLFSKGIILTSRGNAKFVTVYKNSVNPYNICDMAHIIKEELSQRIDKFFEGDTAGIIKGMIVGDKSGISNEVNQIFSKGGISHIIVVSGMHINIILWIMMCALMLFGLGERKISTIICIPVIWFFVLVTGFESSAVRAAIVASVMLCAKLVKREADPLNSLGFAVYIMALVNPAIMFSVGFMLSVGSAFGILVFHKHIQDKLNIGPDVLKVSLSITICAQLGGLPIVSAVFGYTTPVGLFMNMVVCPTITAFTVIIILALILGSVPFLGSGLIWFADKFIKGIIVLCKASIHAPFEKIHIMVSSGIWVAVYLLLLAAVYFMLRKEFKKGKRVSLLCLIIITITLCAKMFSPVAEVVFLDMGSSDCTFLKYRNTTIMFDGGGSEFVNRAQKNIIPFMKNQGIDEVDVAFLTHYHTDHIKGMWQLAKEGKIKNIVVPAGVYKNSFELVNTAREMDIPIYFIGDGASLSLDEINIKGYITYDGKEENNGAVYMAEFGENNIVIAGDIHKDAEKILVNRAGEIDADILKVPHHGSPTSGSEEFIKAITPDISVVMTDEGEYPTEESRLLYKKYNSRLYRTYDCGSIKIKLFKNGKRQVGFGRNNLYELRNIKKAG